MMLGLGNSEISFDIVQSKCSNLGNQFPEISSNSPQGVMHKPRGRFFGLF